MKAESVRVMMSTSVNVPFVPCSKKPLFRSQNLTVEWKQKKSLGKLDILSRDAVYFIFS